MLNSQFFKKFAKPEFKYIAGKRYSNLIVLSVILILSMIAIGLGKGAIAYLEKKMNNPFVSFVSVAIPSQNPIGINAMKSIHDKDHPTVSFNDYYGFIVDTVGVYEGSALFTNLNSNITIRAMYRQAKENDSLYKYILETDSVAKKNKFDFAGWGCVVSLDFLKENNTKLRFDNDNIPFLHYRIAIDDGHEYFSIPIEGFVSLLPEDLDLIVGEKMFKALADNDFWFSLVENDSLSKHYLQYYITEDTGLSDYLVKGGFKLVEYENANILKDIGKLYEKSNISFNELDSINKHVRLSFSDSSFYRVYDFYKNDPPEEKEMLPEKFIFQFNKDKLNSINDFNLFLKKNTIHDGKSLKIDMNIIEAKKNFDLFNKLANLLSISLILFSIFSIVLYITNLIISHISKNKKNLGTLKAFGLSNNNIIIIYSSISIALVTISFLLSYIVSLILGPKIVPLVAKLFEIGDASSLKYINYPFHLLILCFILLPSIAIYLKLRIELKDNTPGDLIYGRE